MFTEYLRLIAVRYQQGSLCWIDKNGLDHCCGMFYVTYLGFLLESIPITHINRNTDMFEED